MTPAATAVSAQGGRCREPRLDAPDVNLLVEVHDVDAVHRGAEVLVREERVRVGGLLDARGVCRRPWEAREKGT